MTQGRLVLVTVTGAVGPAVVEALARAGWTVRAFAKASDERPAFDGAVEFRAGDILDPVALAAATRGAEAVVHMAALLHEMTAQQSPASEYERVNVQGTANVLAAAVSARARRVVLLSTIAVYGPLYSAMADEETPTRPDTLYASTKLAAERLVLSAADGEGRSLGVVLRPGAVYGPRVKGNYRRLVLALDRGRFVPVGDGRNRRSLLFDQDLAQAVLLALDGSWAGGRVFNVTDGPAHPMREILAAVCDALGRRPPPISAGRPRAPNRGRPGNSLRLDGP